VAPSNEIERKLVDLWQQTLHIDMVGIHDSFFELGGDSVLGAQIITSIQKTFGIRVNLQDAFKAFTIESIAKMIEAALIEKIEAMSESEVQEKLKTN
jgi:acyl carrier protein